MTTFLDSLYSLIGITEEDMNTPGHVIEYEGRTYVTPPIIENDDGKENDPIDLVQSRRPATHIAETDPHTEE